VRNRSLWCHAPVGYITSFVPINDGVAEICKRMRNSYSLSSPRPRSNRVSHRQLFAADTRQVLVSLCRASDFYAMLLLSALRTPSTARSDLGRRLPWALNPCPIVLSGVFRAGVLETGAFAICCAKQRVVGAGWTARAMCIPGTRWDRSQGRSSFRIELRRGLIGNRVRWVLGQTEGWTKRTSLTRARGQELDGVLSPSSPATTRASTSQERCCYNSWHAHLHTRVSASTGIGFAGL